MGRCVRRPLWFYMDNGAAG